MTQAVRVKGLRELLAVTDSMPKEVKKGVRDELRKVAVPIRDEAQARFLAEIEPDARRSKYGISVRRVGTVSVEQRVKSKHSRTNVALKRPKFVELQFQRALDPAMEHNERRVVAAMDNVLADLERKWGRG